jgi:hypothetical protein
MDALGQGVVFSGLLLGTDDGSPNSGVITVAKQKAYPGQREIEAVPDQHHGDTSGNNESPGLIGVT